MTLNWRYFVLFASFFFFLPDEIAGIAIPTRTKGSRIVGGGTTYSGQYPFAVAINVQTGDSRFFCGGAVLDVYWVITAARCVYGGLLFTIQEGSDALEGDDYNRVTVAASDHILHPDFNPLTTENDIGLIRLRLPIGYTSYIRPIFLPSSDIASGDTAVVAGWGQVDDRNEVLSNTLRYANLYALSNDECKLTYGDQIKENMLCAVGGYYNEGTCLGDTGDPLFQSDIYGLHYLLGISSFISSNGCESVDPSGFTRVFPYVDWIRSTTGIQ